jgi:hypothetical protein
MVPHLGRRVSVKSKDIKIGMRVWTNISQDCVLVEVVEDRETRGRRYTIKRIDNQKVLSTGRSAAALHETKGPWLRIWEPCAEELTRSVKSPAQP